jgi:hypothetical protein
MVLPGSMGISPHTFHRDEALSCRLRVRGKMAGEHLPNQGRDAPLFLGRERLEGLILPVFKQNMGLMLTFLPNVGACGKRVTGYPRASGRDRTGCSQSSHNGNLRRQVEQGQAGDAL